MIWHKLNSKGDTIVEVLICLAVLGSVIGFTYGIANRSLLRIRAAQERAEALKIAESQTEKIRANKSIPECFSASHCLKNSKYEYWSEQNLTTLIYTTTVKWKKIGSGTDELLTIVYRI